MTLFQLIQQLTLHGNNPAMRVKVLLPSGEYREIIAVSDIDDYTLEGSDAGHKGIGLFLSDNSSNPEEQTCEHGREMDYGCCCLHGRSLGSGCPNCPRVIKSYDKAL